MDFLILTRKTKVFSHISDKNAKATKESKLGKLWLKIEEKINYVLGLIFGFTVSLLSKITPKQIPYLYEKSKSFTQKAPKTALEFTKRKSLELKAKSQVKIQELKKIEIKSQFSELKGKKPKEILFGPFVILYQKFTTMEPRKAMAIIAFVGVFIVSVIGIVSSGSRIYDKTRNPAGDELVEQIPPRPIYYKIDEKQVDLAAVKVPIYSQGKKTVQFLTADFQIQMSTRTSVLFVRKHETQIRDHLVNNVEPMDPVFSFEDEGKRVIKEKLKEEINIFLDDKNAGGEVDDINITYLLGT